MGFSLHHTGQADHSGESAGNVGRRRFRPTGGLLIRHFRQAEMLGRVQGCLLGQLTGDALGSLVEFQPPDAHYRRGKCRSLL